MVRCLSLLALVPSLWGCVVVDFDDCRYQEERAAVVDTSGLTILEVRASSGDLELVGDDSVRDAEIQGFACASRRRYLDDIQISTQRSGDRAIVEAEIPARAVRRGRARLDLQIRVPRSLAIQVEDSSGDIDIRNVASLDVADRSGDVGIFGIAGDVSVRDSSGDIQIEDVEGRVTLRDGSGDVRIRAAGSVLVEEDGSGDLYIREIDGDVLIEDDGSGDIDVAVIGGELEVRDSGSGDVDYEQIAGRVDVDR
jgi:hypothetical protein